MSMHLNIKAIEENSFDAIVVGTGISGGWAAMELSTKGLKTLVIERGRDVKHVADYPTMFKNPWELTPGDRVTAEEAKNYPIQGKIYAFHDSTKHWWVNDLEHPYIQEKPFDWIRGNHVGGRSIMWGRQSYRLSDLDFEANAKDGHGVDWPIRYKDLEPWYDYVESFIGVSGQAEGLPQLPDGKFLPPMEMNCLEQHVSSKIRENYSDRIMTIGRVANLTGPKDGRGQCQFRNLCYRGCPYGGYFSSQSSTLPKAMQTGNMTLLTDSIVAEVIFDKDSGKASGVRVINSVNGSVEEYFAKIIFLNASTLGTTQILLNSISDRFPDGLGNSSGQLGHNLMDHHYIVGASGEYDGFEDKYYYVSRPNGIYVPRFRNIDEQRSDFIRGYGYQGSASRENWTRGIREMSIGRELKELLQRPGIWTMGLGGFGECLPYYENMVSLDKEKKDKFGMPLLKISAEYKENEWAMRKDMASSAAEMLETAGLKNIREYDAKPAPGLAIHEMGTARMGKDPKTSVLNKHNQMHDLPNVFITDGAAMTSSGCQNPSLTYMALTARACDYAVKAYNNKNI